MIWLNVAHFSHDSPHEIDDFNRTNHHRIMKQIALETDSIGKRGVAGKC